MNPQFLKSALVVVGLLAVVGLTVNFGVVPEWNKFQEKLTQARQVDDLTNLEVNELRRVQALSLIQPAIEQQLSFLERAVPLDIEISSYVDLLDELAARNGIEINFLTIGDAPPYVLPEHVASEEGLKAYLDRVGDSLNGIPVKFVVTGGFNNLVSFMGELQQSPRTTLVQNATLTAGSGTRTFNLNLETFIFAIGIVEAPADSSTTDPSTDTTQPTD